jgi:signal transduction histidine kinase
MGMKFEHLVGAVIHDLKNQLQALLDYEQEAIARIPKRYHNHLQPILLRTSRLKNDTMQMVSLFRLEHKSHFPMDDAWPKDTVADAIEATSSQYPTIRFVNNISDDCQGFYNEELINLALVTLITNCAQAGATEITLSADDSEGLTIRIEDNGHGFDDDVLSGQRETTKEEGTGLGLYFVQLIAEHHNQGELLGRVDISNRPRGGACVCLFLP